MPEVFVAKVADFPDGERRTVQHGPHDIGVFHWGGQFFAYSNICLHQGGPAYEGLIMHRCERSQSEHLAMVLESRPNRGDNNVATETSLRDCTIEIL